MKELNMDEITYKWYVTYDYTNNFHFPIDIEKQSWTNLNLQMKIKNQVGINKFIKILLLSIFFINSNSISAQNDIFFETYYKNRPDLKFTEERFSFKFIANEKVLIQNDIDLNVQKKYFVNFYDSTYTEDSANYMIAYAEDLNKHYELFKNTDVRMFMIIYDKKNGDILALKIQRVEGNNLIDFYLTKKGKEILKFDEKHMEKTVKD